MREVENQKQHIVAIFCDICVKEVAKGNRPGTHFDRVGWENVVKAFNELTGRDYDKKQLKNKWDYLKTDWKLWNSLLHKETGIGWDPAKKTVDGPAEWWKIKFRCENLYFSLYLLCLLFVNNDRFIILCK